MSRSRNEKIFYFHCPTRETATFRILAGQAARLREFGRVAVIISDQAAPDRGAMPKDRRSPWHDYAVTSPGMHRFFPHPLIEPHLDPEFVRANRSLWDAKAAILEEFGLEAAWWGVEPHFLPLAFFEAHPHLRGPRCDHPRRSRQEAFSLCPDTPAGREIVAGMVERMRRATPNLSAVIFKTNDAGGTLCWAHAGYDGPNGPAHCRNLSPGQHMANLVNALHEGARRGGGDVQVVIGHSNFWNNEIFDLRRCLPANTLLTGIGCDSTVQFGPLDVYPVRSLVDPVTLIAAGGAVHAPRARHVFVHFRSSYDRAGAEPATVAKTLDLLLDGAKRPAKTSLDRARRLRGFCLAWAGPAHADRVMEAFEIVHRAMRESRIAAPRFNLMYTAVSLRHLTRPLLFDPRRLSPGEEAYFLPYVFNPYETQAREDYINLHGTRIDGCAGNNKGNPALIGALESVRNAAALLEAAADDGAPESGWLRDTAAGWRLWSFLTRGVHNFYLAQRLRDRHAWALAREDYVHPSQPSPEGEGEILLWKAIMRDELENTESLADFLAGRGAGRIVFSPDPSAQDTFTLGPDFLEDIRTKIRLMREHWRDVEDYLAPPHK